MKKKTIYRWVLILIVAAAASATMAWFGYKTVLAPWFRTGGSSGKSSGGITYGVPVRVERVIDGDTIVLAADGVADKKDGEKSEEGERLRYVGMDTPEEVDPRKPVQCFAEEAAARNKALLDGNNVIIYKDVSERDQYGRLLGFVYLAGSTSTNGSAAASSTFVNLELVKEGYAFAYPFPPDISKEKEFAAAENDAREHKRGLWGACLVRRTTSGREQTNAK